MIDTPEFMRGIHAVGGFNPAPALEPQLGGYYWVTPIAKTWSQERVESKLRGYNNFGLQHLTIHEAMPGHYVQLEYANHVEPQSRRALSSIFRERAVCGRMGFYTQLMVVDEGYLADQPDIKLTLYKQILRGVSNAILDSRLQTMGMTDGQALDLMINDTYQEKKEAAAKLQGAQLPSCQLPTYFAGGEAGWRRVTDISRNGALHSRSGISTNSFEGRCFSGQTLEVPRPHQKEAF